MRENKNILNGVNYWPYLFLSPFIILYTVLQLFPIAYSFFVSFTKWDGIGPKTFVGFDNYIRVFTVDPYFYKAFGNTLFIMAVTIPLCILLGVSMAGLMFNLSRGKKWFQTLNFLPYITTPVAIGLIFAVMFDWTGGAVNLLLIKLNIISEGINWLGEAHTARILVMLLIIWKYTGYHMTIYLAGMSSISSDLYEAAKMDGANAIQAFIRITIPLLAPITVFLVITNIIGSLQLFDEPQLLFNSDMGGAAIIGGPERSVLTLMWHYFDVTFNRSEFGYGSAVAFSIFLVIIGFSLISLKVIGRREQQ